MANVFIYDEERVLVLIFCALALLFSIPFHILLIVVLVRYRNTNEFTFPFFKMLLSLTINDLITAFVLFISYIMYTLPHKVLAEYAVPWHNIMTEGFFVAGLCGDLIILLAIGINRLVAYVFPHETIWYPIHTKCAIVLQWIYAISLGIPTIHPDFHGTNYFNETAGVLMETLPESMAYQIKSFVDILITLLAGLALVIIYSVCVGKLIHHKLTINAGQGSQNLSTEALLSFQGFMLSSSMLVGGFMSGYAVVNNFSVSLSFFVVIFIVGVSNFVLGPFIVIGMSKIIRKHIKKLFKLEANVVHVLPTNNNNNPNCQESQL